MEGARGRDGGYAEGLMWLQKAAQHGHPKALFNLALLLQGRARSVISPPPPPPVSVNAQEAGTGDIKHGNEHEHVQGDGGRTGEAYELTQQARELLRQAAALGHEGARTAIALE